jgi:hypothetical protein
VALDFKPGNEKHLRVRAELPRSDRTRWRLPAVGVASRPGDTRSQQKLLRALAQLPPALQGPVLRSGRAAVVRPSAPRQARNPRPLMSRLLAGELQVRSVLLLAATFVVVGIVTALGSNLFW